MPQTIDDLVNRVASYDPEAKLADIRRAYAFAAEAHKDQKRASGQPYIIHPLAAAMTLAEMRLPDTLIIAALLHDVPEDTDRTLQEKTPRTQEKPTPATGRT
jgi:GTP pyrophosphokinase